MTRRLRLGILLATLVAAVCLGAASHDALAQSPVAPAVQAPSPAPAVAAPAAARIPRQALRYESGTGGIVNLPAAAANVFVADPKIAEVRPASATTLFIFGVGAGCPCTRGVDSAIENVARGLSGARRPPCCAVSVVSGAATNTATARTERRIVKCFSDGMRHPR